MSPKKETELKGRSSTVVAPGKAIRDSVGEDGSRVARSKGLGAMTLQGRRRVSKESLQVGKQQG